MKFDQNRVSTNIIFITFIIIILSVQSTMFVKIIWSLCALHQNSCLSVPCSVNSICDESKMNASKWIWIRKLAKYKSVMRYHLGFGRLSRTVCSTVSFSVIRSYFICFFFFDFQFFFFLLPFIVLSCECQTGYERSKMCLWQIKNNRKIEVKINNAHCTLYMYAIRISSLVFRISNININKYSWLCCTMHNAQYKNICI